MPRLLDNPITRAELLYQWRSPYRWYRAQPIIRGLYHGLLTISLVLFLGRVISDRIGFDSIPIEETLRPLLYGLLATALVAHFSTVTKTLTLASQTFTREKQSRTWDLVLLTGIDARQVVYSKWWATVRRMWPSFVIASALRLGLLFWLWQGMEVARAFSLYYGTAYLSPVGFLFAEMSVFLLTLANAVLTASFGVLASLLADTGRQALVLAIIMRTVMLAGLAAVLWILGDITYRPSPFLSLVVTGWLEGETGTVLLRLSSLTMVDNGSILALGYGAGALPFSLFEYPLWLLGPLLLYLSLTWVVLRLAQFLAVRQGALPPMRTNQHHPGGV